MIKKIKTIAKKSFDNNVAAFTGYLNNQIIGQVLFYILISSILLFFSVTLKIKATDTVSFIFTLIFLLGSMEAIMLLLPGLVKAQVASNHLMDLKQELEVFDLTNPISEKCALKQEFNQISIKNLKFYYGDSDTGFGIGPINLDVRKGEVIFIYGGNGSGKTTFVHSVIGLYHPSTGEIRLNGLLIDKDNYLSYRTQFSVVFSDFYLFNEVYGVDHINIEKWNYYIRLFEIEGKVKIENRCFSTTDLSTGQRKRLALIAALLEEKPVLILDEWAADQDPYFRKKFYTEIVPLLKKEGVTILAITHDDKYYHCADKLFKMDDGKLIEESISTYESNLIS